MAIIVLLISLSMLILLIKSIYLRKYKDYYDREYTHLQFLYPLIITIIVVLCSSFIIIIDLIR